MLTASLASGDRLQPPEGEMQNELFGWAAAAAAAFLLVLLLSKGTGGADTTKRRQQYHKIANAETTTPSLWVN